MMKKVNVLGTEYSISYESDEKVAADMCGFPGEFGGYCDGYSKKIVIANGNACNDTEMTKNERKRESLRHEIGHAFLNESGVKANSNWAQNEELVDWIAIQAPKIFKLFEKLEVL